MWIYNISINIWFFTPTTSTIPTHPASHLRIGQFISSQFQSFPAGNGGGLLVFQGSRTIPSWLQKVYEPTGFPHSFDIFVDVFVTLRSHNHPSRGRTSGSNTFLVPLFQKEVKDPALFLSEKMRDTLGMKWWAFWATPLPGSAAKLDQDRSFPGPLWGCLEMQP